MRLKAVAIEEVLLIIDLENHDVNTYSWNASDALLIAEKLNENPEALKDAFDGDGNIFDSLCDALGV